MNLNPAVEELAQSIQALQDYMNDAFEELKAERNPVSPEDFKEIMHNHFADFMDSNIRVQDVIEKTVETMCKQYQKSFNEGTGMANVYKISDYRKPPISENVQAWIKAGSKYSSNPRHWT